MIGKIGMSMLFLAILAAVCAPAQAVLITNGATTILNDGFEGYTVGVAPPSPWVAGVAPGSTTGGVVDNASPPGAFEGSNYLRLQRGGQGIPGESVSFASQTSGTVKLTFMANTGSGGYYSGIVLKDTVSGSTFQLSLAGKAGYLGPASVYGYVPGPGLQNLGLNWTDGVWKKVEFEYKIGDPTATVRVDGVAATATTPSFSGLNGLDYWVTSDFGSELNVDAVPEPATMVLLSLGGLGLLRRRKA